MTTPSLTNPITSTKQLKYDGLLGYAKTIVAVVSGVITAVLPLLPLDSNLTRYLQIASTALGALGVYLVPNKVKETPPAPVDPPTDVQPLAGRHEAPTVKPAGELGWGIAQPPPGPGTD